MAGMNAPDPWAFQRWAFETQTGNSIRKAVLVSLTVMADINTGRCEVRQDTLCQQVEAGERAVRGHLKALEDARLIARRHQYRFDGKRRGDEFLLLAPWVTTWPDGRPVDALPAHDAGSTTGISEQSLPAPNAGARTTTSGNDQKKKGARVQLPADFPEDLRPHLKAVYRVFRDFAQRHAIRDPNPVALAQLLMVNRRKPVVQAAYECAAHWEGQGRKDIVACYRNWLKNAEALASIEFLGEDGLPAARNGVTPGVTRMRGRGTDQGELMRSLLRAGGEL